MKHSADPVIVARQVHKNYAEVSALNGVDLRVNQGEVVAILGPNGAGKSTLFDLFLGLARPSSGDVLVLGRPPGQPTRLRIGAMLQSVGLPDHVKAHELLTLVGAAHPRALPVPEVLERIGLSQRSHRRVTDLSGGERQRLQLGMALIGAPELLLLDEPTAAMDILSRRAFWAQTQEAADHGVTVLFATHDLAEARTMAHRVVVLANGRVLADASPEELTEHGGRDLEEVFLTLTEELSTAAPEGAHQ
jgi:ABC-2 type transport system ATP-binding protein